MSISSSLHSFAFRPETGPIRVRNADVLDSEFRYYSKLIEDLTLLLSKKEDREAVPPWVHKLSSAGYNVTPLRDKRNRYMLMLCISLSLDSVEGPFIISPPTGILTDLKLVQPPEIPEFEWEQDRTWEEEIENYQKVEKAAAEKKEPTTLNTAFYKCPFHRRTCPKDNATDRSIGQVMDQQFRFLLHLCRPYVNLLFRASDKNRAAKWIQRLCLIDPDSTCCMSKGLRNDYMMVLSGYLTNRCLVGPFQDFPLEKLIPLPDLAKINAGTENVPITHPQNPRTAQFFRDMPTPVEGAFAIIACTGDLYEPRYR